MDERLEQHPNVPETGAPTDGRRTLGCWLVGGGVAAAVISLFNIASSSLTLVGDVMSGGMVPGHGQNEINRSAIGAGMATSFLVLGVIVAVAGAVVLMTRKKS